MINTRRRLHGVVTKAKLEKTVTVKIDRSFRHKLYGKVIRTRKNYLVHDELGCELGDQVRIVESRPISKRKRWVVEEIVRRPTETELVASTKAPVDEPEVEMEVGGAPQEPTPETAVEEEE